MAVSRRFGLPALATVWLFGSSCGTRSRVDRDIVAVYPATGSLVAFHSGFWLNLHHLLYQQARARRGVADASFPATVGAQSDTAGLRTLGSRQQAAWGRALAFYDSALAGRPIDFDSTIIETNYALADIGAGRLTVRAGLSPGLATVLEGAAEGYRALWWPRHDVANRAWVMQLDSLLGRYGDSIVPQLERIYEVRWPRHPVPVEVVRYANWAGAYTTFDPTLVTMSSVYRGHRGTLGLEQLFHEVSHAMTDSLDAAFRAAGVNPWDGGAGHDAQHAIIFFTAGEFVRRAIPAHVPYAEWRGLWTGTGPLARNHDALMTTWLPYLEGKTTMRGAIAQFATAMASVRQP